MWIYNKENNTFFIFYWFVIFNHYEIKFDKEICKTWNSKSKF